MFNYRSVHCLGLWNLLSEIPFPHQSQSSKSYNTLLVSLHLIMTDHSLSLFLFCVTMCYSNDKQTFALSEVETWELPSGVIKHRAQPHYDKKRWHCARITLEPDGDSHSLPAWWRMHEMQKSGQQHKGWAEMMMGTYVKHEKMDSIINDSWIVGIYSGIISG